MSASGDGAGPVRRPVLLIGGGDLTAEVNEALEAGDADVTWLQEADDEAVREALEGQGPDVVAVVAREDSFPLRMALLVRHLDADVPLVVTIFDPAVAEQVAETVPHCRVTSLADIVAPSLAAPCLGDDVAAVLERDGGLVTLHEDGSGGLTERSFRPRRASRLRALATAVLVPYDTSAALLFYGFMGLLAILVFEAVGAVIVLDQPWADAIYGSTKSLVTVGPNDKVADGPAWFKLAISASMLIALLCAACFTGGLINRLVDTRLTGLAGRRAVPRSDHVVVVGLGQVGLRLCLLLRRCGVSVVAVDTEADGENVGLARRLRLPVVIGRGANPALLRKLSLPRASAFAAVTPDDLANIQAVMAGRTLHRELRVVLRAGDGEVTDETRSLLAIGRVIDVHRLGAAFIAGIVLGADATAVAVCGGEARLVAADGRLRDFPMAVPT